ncbi:MAG: hypothetical protein P0Y65_19735 [Candidatus Devosia phytovorans]|uniref:Uncharacterized protein n=1 Tax=Candidatus Devosia phytovorans TaxID=3121372 RepID=A0AAJ5VUX4_9HYPH|nr:hypothetical protein [Devosia sp.]WEK04380.1 MAG: hypothetical protein P0Y65_19735 [Devosia sp.]
MPRIAKKKIERPQIVREWTLPAAATLGSSVRVKGILLEIRAKLPAALKKMLDVRASVLILSMDEDAEGDFRKACVIVDKTLDGIEDLPVIPREIEDILTIKTSERHRWLKDGRLPSAGTRTVKLRGRAKKITFHVFDPRRVEELLDGEAIASWREEDAATAAENRRRATWKAKLARSQKSAEVEAPAESGMEEGPRPKLVGWEEFERDGLLR